jgi:hypothetical protein
MAVQKPDALMVEIERLRAENADLRLLAEDHLKAIFRAVCLKYGIKYSHEGEAPLVGTAALLRELSAAREALDWIGRTDIPTMSAFVRDHELAGLTLRELVSRARAALTRIDEFLKGGTK